MCIRDSHSGAKRKKVDEANGKVQSWTQGWIVFAGSAGPVGIVMLPNVAMRERKNQIAWPIWSHHNIQILDLLSEMGEDRPGDSSHPFSIVDLIGSPIARPHLWIGFQIFGFSFSMLSIIGALPFCRWRCPLAALFREPRGVPRLTKIDYGWR